MKSFNIDSELKKPEIIKKAIIKTCKSKSKKEGKNRKYKQAQYILKNIDEYTKKTLEIIDAFEKVQRAKEYGGKVDVETYRIAYKPKKCKTFTTKETSNKKERKITSAPLFPDQVIHQLIVIAMEPVLMRYMYRHSYGSIPGRGIHSGKQYVSRIINHHTSHNKSEIKYAAQLDIAKCYENISHKELKKQLKRKFKGKLLLWLAFSVIDSYHDKIIDGDPRGLPIGYSTSHWFCNFMLTPLDYFIKQKLGVRYYIRYMDDMVLFGRNKKTLHKNVRAIRRKLNEIGLELKYTWQVFRFDYIDKDGNRRGRDIDFLGYRFFRDKVLLRKRNALKLRRQIIRIHKKEKISIEDAQSLMSRLGWLRHCNSLNFWNKYVKPYINIKEVKEVIRNESRKHYKTSTI